LQYTPSGRDLTIRVLLNIPKQISYLFLLFSLVFYNYFFENCMDS
jgi:hypothetical protein